MPDRPILQDSLIGLEFGHYRILERVGSGGMGVVYRGYDAHLEREVAIKVLNPGTIANDLSRKRFRNEARALSKLNHPIIATVHDFHTQEGRDFLVMEYIAGLPLSKRLAEGSLPEKDVIALGVQLAEGLSAAHEQGVVHRDLKPGNLVLTKDSRLKILDFGLAKLRFPSKTSPASETVSETHVMAGTLPYMAPEQVLGGEIDGRTDIHAAGIVLYQMATGLPPFAATDRSELMNEVLRSSPPPANTLNPRLSPELTRIIGKCLERDPDNRYQSAKELGIDLRRLQAGSTLSGLQPAVRPTRWRSAKAVWLGLFALASVLVLFFVFARSNWRGRIFGGANTPHIESLAVLPLANLSGDPQQEYFADGMTEELISDLGNVGALRVISRTSVMQYKQTKKALPQIAKELNVDAIVEGSVLRSGNRVRITAQLIQAKAERHLWGKSYERDVADILTLQSDVAQAITSEVKAKITPQEQARLANTRPVNPEAYDVTLKGEELFQYATRPEQIQQAIGLFQRALEKDPTYAQAWAGLGEALWTLAATGFESIAPGEVRQKAIAASEKALELDENLPDAHVARATIAVDGEWDFSEAQRHYERALELRPGYAAAHRDYGEMLFIPLSRFDEARRHLDRARELDPLSPWNDIYMVAWWRDQGLPDKAIEQAERARQSNPALWVIPLEMGFARFQLGHPNQAATEFEAALNLLGPERPAPVLAPLGLAYGLAGRRTEALKILDELKVESGKRYVPPNYLATVYAGLGRTDAAFQLLEQALKQRTPSLVYLNRHDALSEVLRSDPRWQPFIERLRQAVRLPPGTPDPFS